MDEGRARELLARLNREVPGGAVLWRGPDLAGSDVDVLVAPGREHAVAEALRGAGLSPAPQVDGRVMWRSLDEAAVVIDSMPAAAWPPSYPSLDGVLARCIRRDGEMAVASVEDRLLIRGAEAVAGRPVEHVVRKAAPLLAEPEARERLREVAAAEDAAPLAELIASPSRLEATARRGRVPYRAALAAAARSPRARAALRERIATRLGSPRRAPLPPVPPGARGALIALSGMDGAGKSTAALDLMARLDASGRPAVVAWSRLAAESELLDLIAVPVRKLLRRSGPGADRGTEAAGPRLVSAERRGIVNSVWVAIVAAVNARGARRTARPSRAGLVVLCDRWLADALVDLELRYGRHRAAAWLLRRAFPTADLTILLEIDAETAARRKPGDQSEEVLAAMAERYGAVADELGFPPAGRGVVDGRVRIDATGDGGAVRERIAAEVTALLGD